MADKIRKRLHH